MEGLKGIEGLELPGVPLYNHVHSHHLFIVKVCSMTRDSFMKQLSAYNIGYGLHFPATHRLQYVQKMRDSLKSNLPETERAAGKIISLPLFPDMMDSDAYYVCDAIRDILK
jgi:UDP-4-amino-4-deoxy-L-arabinose-oxoglutarate aminotransferase